MLKRWRERKTERDLRHLKARGYVYSYWVAGELRWALTEKGKADAERLINTGSGKGAR